MLTADMKNGEQLYGGHRSYGHRAWAAVRGRRGTPGGASRAAPSPPTLSHSRWSEAEPAKDGDKPSCAPRWLQDPATRLQAVWAAAPDPMVLTDAFGMVLDVNPAYCALAGADPTELIGQDVASIYPEAERVTARARYRDTFATAEPGAEYYATIQRPDGTTRVVACRFSFLTAEALGRGEPAATRANGTVPRTPAPAPPGRRVAVLTSMRDVTEIVTTQRAIAAALDKERAELEQLALRLERRLSTAAPDATAPATPCRHPAW